MHIAMNFIALYFYVIWRVFIGQSQSEVRVTTQFDHQSRHVDDDGRQVIHGQDGKPQMLAAKNNVNQSVNTVNH